MGTVLNWLMPIEWDDGTAAWLDARDRLQLLGGKLLGTYSVTSVREPRGWNRRTMPQLRAGSPILVAADGRLDSSAGNAPGAPRLRNVTLPPIRFADDSTPVWGEILNDGTALRLGHHSGLSWHYHWPSLEAGRGSPELKVVTFAEVAAEEKKAIEAEAMQDNPLYGMF